MKMYCLMLGFIFIIGTYTFADESSKIDIKVLKEKAEALKRGSQKVTATTDEFVKEIIKEIKHKESCIEKEEIRISELKEILNALGIPQAESETFDLRPFGINLEVANVDEKVDALFRYTFSEAQEACAKKGMRVPTPTELGQMFCHGDHGRRKSEDYPESDPGCIFL